MGHLLASNSQTLDINTSASSDLPAKREEEEQKCGAIPLIKEPNDIIFSKGKANHSYVMRKCSVLENSPLKVNKKEK